MAKQDNYKRGMRIQLRAFELDILGLEIDEIAKIIAKEHNIIVLDDKYIKSLIDAESVLYMIALNS